MQGFKTLRKKFHIILLFLILLSFCLRFYKFDLPLTLNEAKEGYTAYSIIKTGKDTNGDKIGFFFKTDNDYVSTLGVYSKIPFIFVQGFNISSLRLSSVLASLILVGVFYLLLKNSGFSGNRLLFTTALVSYSPVIFVNSIFDAGAIFSLVFILTAVLFLQKKQSKYFLVFLIFSFFSNFFVLPVLIALFVFWAMKKGKRFALISVVFIAASGLLTLKSQPDLSNFFLRHSLISDIMPSTYTHLIERRLSIGLDEGSPLISKKFNFNRLGFNKYSYFFYELSGAVIRPFNYELLTSPVQSSTLTGIEKRTDSGMISFFFWEPFLIFVSLIFAYKKLPQTFKIMLFSGLFSIIFFKQNLYYLIIPVYSVSAVFFLEKILLLLKKSFRQNGFIFAAFLLFFFSFVGFFDLLWYHPQLWFNKADFYEYLIWNSISDKDFQSKKIFATDRIGEPVFYMAAYKKIEPDIFLKQKKEGPVVDSGIKRISGVGNVVFGSFKYYESPRGKDEIWVGFPGEFVGSGIGSIPDKKVVDGEIFGQIDDIKMADSLIGNELWFVKTTFKTDEK